MNLYELTSEWAYLRTLLADIQAGKEDVEPSDIEKALNDVQGDRLRKFDGCARMILNLDAEAGAVGAEIERLKTRRERIEANAERLRQWVAANMLPGEKIETPIGRLSVRESEGVVPKEKNTPIPEAYQRTKITVTPDLKTMGVDLKCGADIPGWYIEKRLNLQIK